MFNVSFFNNMLKKTISIKMLISRPFNNKQTPILAFLQKQKPRSEDLSIRGSNVFLRITLKISCSLIIFCVRALSDKFSSS